MRKVSVEIYRVKPAKPVIGSIAQPRNIEEIEAEHLSVARIDSLKIRNVRLADNDIRIIQDASRALEGVNLGPLDVELEQIWRFEFQFIRQITRRMAVTVSAPSDNLFILAQYRSSAPRTELQ